MIGNQRAARIVAAVVIAMLVITMFAALFGCTTTQRAEADPDSGLAWVSAQTAAPAGSLPAATVSGTTPATTTSPSGGCG